MILVVGAALYVLALCVLVWYIYRKQKEAFSLLVLNDKMEQIPKETDPKYNTLTLGDKFKLSGVGDKHGDDRWLRVFNKDGTGYDGSGVAADHLWAGEWAWVRDLSTDYIRSHHGIVLDAPDKGIKAISMRRTDENKRGHQWSLWHMNNQYGKNDLQLWEYAADAGGSTCGGKQADGAMCEPALSVKGHRGPIATPRVLKVRHPHGGWTDNAAISTQAVNGQIGPSFAGQQHWSHFPWENQWTYIRPGRTDTGVVMGDIGNGGVHIGHAGNQTHINSGVAYVGRHVDAKMAWGGANPNPALFMGWQGGKTVVGNHKTGGHDYAYNAPEDSVVVTNPLRVHNTLCVGSTCINEADLARMKK